MPWVPDERPLAYDCSSLHADGAATSIWHRTCRHAVMRHQPRHPARLLSWREAGAGRPNVRHLVRQLGNRTVWILGDSHALDLWCALTCVVLRASNSSELQHHGSQMLLVTRLRPDNHHSPSSLAGAAREVRWRVPTCAYAKGGKCGQGTHCGTLGRASCGLGCGLSLLPPPDAQPGALVLYSPCPAYASSPLMRTVLSALNVRERAELDRFRDLPPPLLKGLCEQHVAASANCSGGAFELSAAAEHYASTAATAARALRRLHELSGGRSVGVLFLAPTSHFPTLEGRLDAWSDARLDGEGSYERLVASALSWLHAHLQVRACVLISRRGAAVGGTLIARQGAIDCV